MKNASNLAKVVYKRTYARNDLGHIENFNETIERVIKGNTEKYIGTKYLESDEIEKLTNFALNRKALPAGRGLWFSGSPSHEKLGGAALNNCWATTSEDIENFVMAMDLLMLGGGVGMSIEHRFTSKLPKIKKNVTILHVATKDADFIVPDSRSGWCELFRRVLESFFITGKSFTYSTVCVRGFGEVIKGFGGVSSGPIPLITFVDKIIATLISRTGKHIRPIDAMDLICITGELVVAGNVRRSAIIIMGDAWDKEYLSAKRWDLGQIPSHRAMANLSVVCENVDDLHPLFWKTYEHGEAFGVVNRKNIQKFGRMGEKLKDSAYLVNPCVTGDTEILTRDGYERIDSLIDQEVEVWNGFEWSSVTPKVTGHNQPLIKVKTKLGKELICTVYHKFYTRGLYQRNQTTWDCWSIKAINLTIGVKLLEWITPDGEEVFDEIIGLESAGIADVVYCFNEPKRNLGVFNGIITGQCGESTLEDGEPCNLQEIFLPNLKDKEEFKLAARLMHRYGKRVTMENYHNPKNDEMVKRNRRIGTGITGCLQSDLFTANILDEAYQTIQDENVKYSKLLGINESIRTTLIKPSGTLSLLGDCTPGIHPSYSKYYIRRVRFSSTDSLVPALAAAGHHVEPVQKFDGTLDHNTLVVDFYCETPAGTPCADEEFDTSRQLDTLLFSQKHWSDQAVSVTVYYKKDEINKVKEWLSNNLKNIKTVSFLCHNDHGFKQAPLEKISKEVYNELSDTISQIDIEKIGDGSMVSSLECEGGICPVK